VCESGDDSIFATGGPVDVVQSMYLIGCFAISCDILLSAASSATVCNRVVLLSESLFLSLYFSKTKLLFYRA